MELSYGGLDAPRDESTDITSYSYEGYNMGERIRVNRPPNLVFDEISVTYGYLGDLNSPGVNKRFRQLRQSNFDRFKHEHRPTTPLNRASKRLGKPSEFAFLSLG